jgi:hypothetical protein
MKLLRKKKTGGRGTPAMEEILLNNMLNGIPMKNQVAHINRK